jgi:hypothetical protein
LTGLRFYHLPLVPFHQPSGSSGRRDIGPPNTHPWPNPPSPPAVLDWPPSIFLRKIIGPPGFEFPWEAQIHSIVERVARMGEGRSEGANPGPPNSHPFSALMAVRSEGVTSPLPRKQFATVIGYYGLCWGLQDYLKCETCSGLLVDMHYHHQML